ncbi:MAG: protein kinase [Burkholderiales bacterium]|nr:MAG: protein kinase [Burkholderiales bacterium]
MNPAETSTLEQLRSGALAGARRLDLSSAGLEQLPPEVFGLADTLEVLSLNGNRLVSLPHDLGRLRRLRILFCSDNPFERLPASLGGCDALDMVGFKACRLSEIPAESLPAKLRWLILTDNRIDRLPAALGERRQLQKLMLAGNRLATLPDTLAEAHRLELLRLSANRFESLPPWLTELPRLAWLALAGNPLGWRTADAQPLPVWHWSGVRLGPCLGEGASGRIHRVAPDGQGGAAMALKLFKGAVTSDGLPQDEMRAHRVAGDHPNLCGPVAELTGHPDGTPGVFMPLLSPEWQALADPPSFESCTRDVYAPGRVFAPQTVRAMARSLASALTRLHRRGVLHGDFYAHNVLHNPVTDGVVLSDFGAASLLPSDRGDLRRRLCATDVRAWGILVGELLERVLPSTSGHDGLDPLRRLVQDCLQAHPLFRPTAEELSAHF